MIVTMMIMVVMAMIIGLQKGWLQFKNAVEIKCIAAKHGIEWHIALHRAVNLRIRIDPANTRFDLFNLGR